MCFDTSLLFVISHINDYYNHHTFGYTRILFVCFRCVHILDRKEADVLCPSMNTYF
jgi:hypothetical protein